MVLGLAAVAVVTFVSLRSILDGELNSSILNVASIQAASLTDGPEGEMHFHEWALTPDEAVSLRDLIRYAQVWQADGVSLLRSQYMARDLPLDRVHLGRAADGRLVWTETEWDGVPIRTLYYPLERFGAAHQRHVLQVAAPLVSRNKMLARVGGFLGLLVLVMGGATYGGAWWLAGRAIRPVDEVIDQADSIRGGSLNRRIRAYAEVKEYRRLVDVLNGMLDRIQTAFEAQRRFTADASHELRSPLTAMRGELELALRRPRERDEYRRVIDSTLEEVVRLSRITEDLLVLARSDSGALLPRTERVQVGATVARVLGRLEPSAEEKGVALSLHAEPESEAVIDPGLLGQVAWNLVHNAIKFTPAGGRVDVSVTIEPTAVAVEVRDTGPGFRDPEEAFRRFYREDEARTLRISTEGTGLGLAIVQAIAEAHGGTATAANLSVGGACVTVTWPVPRPAPPEPAQGDAATTREMALQV
jgi:two-component system OmpR family sensor kinase